jgi:uncharacterized membrane protein
MTPSPEPAWRKLVYPLNLQTVLALCALIFFGSILRFSRAASDSLWLDEAVSARLASLQLPGLLDMAHHEFVGIAYFVRLQAWHWYMGASELSLRAASLIPSILGIALIYPIGRRLLGQSGAILAVALLAISPLDVWYAREARMYAQSSLVSMLTLLCFLRYRDGRGPIWAVAASLAGLLGFHTLFTMLAIPVALSAVLVAEAIFSPERRRLLAPWLASQTLIVAGVAPWWSILAGNLRDIARNPSRWQALYRVSAALEGAQLGGSIWWVLATAAAIGLIGCAVAGTWAYRNPRMVKRLVARPLLLLLGGLGPLVLITLTATWRPSSSIRQLMPLLPYVVLAAAAALTRLPPKLDGWATIMLVALCLGGTARTQLEVPKEEWREAASYVVAHAAPGDLSLTHAEYTQPAFTYYAGEAIPSARAPHVSRMELRLPEVVNEYERVWLVLSHDRYVDPSGRIAAWFDAHHTLEDAQSWHGVRVRLYRLNPTSP